MTNDIDDQDIYQEAADHDEKLINELIERRDVNGLVGVLESEADAMLCLSVAKALAQLGDDRGLDYLIAALDIPDTDVNFAAKEILTDLDNPQGNLALTSHLSSNTHPEFPGKRDALNAKYPYLTAYVGFIAVSAVAAVGLSFVPFGSLLTIIIGFYIFKFVIQHNILPYK